jgi:hypothetical protein
MFDFLPHCLGQATRLARNRLALAFCLFPLIAGPLWAKDAPINGVFLYGASGSVAYVQIAGFLVNGKSELRACNGSAGIDKSAYKNLPKIAIVTLKTLERLPDGSLVAQSGEGAASCVVPSNYKFEKDETLTPAQLAEKSTYTAQVVGSSATPQSALPAFAPGAKLVFGSNTDKEFAEYSLADRVQTISAWQSYLAAYSAGIHTVQGKADLTLLLVKDGKTKLALFVASRGAAAPDYTSLKQAHERAEQALAVESGDTSATALRDAVRAELKLLCDSSNAKLQAFQEATKAHKPGFALLVSAIDLSDHVATIDSKYPPGVATAAAVSTEKRSLDSIVQTADSQITAGQNDDAYSTITKYRSFADEEPRLKRIVETVYKYHFDKGNSEIASASWQEAVADFKAANDITPNEESRTLLSKAEAGLVQAQNKAAADKAIGISKDRTDSGDTIGAYEVLANLTPDQQLLVKDQMTALQDAYVKAATLKAKDLESSHKPIRGKADEDGMRQAYDYLDRAEKLTDDPEIKAKLDLMASTIADYYVVVANRYLSKPLSSGVGLGWAFLNEADHYQPNLSAVRDAMTTNNAAYQMRARLSVGVLFRDQTSRRDSAGFADQLQQAFATGLETSGLPVRVILPGAGGTLEPNFRFVGDILQHRPIRTVKKDTLQSQYRSGSREIPNEAWNKADQQYEAAELELQKIQNVLNTAHAKNNKKQIEAAEKEFAAIEATVQSTRSAMNSIPKTVGEDVISPYNYTRTTLELANVVELSFRTIDSSGATIGEATHVTKGEKPMKFVILDNIKPDDTKGLKEIDTQPDENQLMTDVEIEARDEIVKAASERVQELPSRILTQARAKAAANDLDGAGEAYVLYLNCTNAKVTPERTEALFFLNRNFNIRNTVNLRAGTN